jgi:hypothetical protein
VVEPHYWLNIGAGGGSVRGGFGNESGGIAGGVSLSYQSRNHLFTLRHVTLAEFKLDLFGSTGPAQAISDVGLLYGRVAKTRHAVASISGGIGIVSESHTPQRSPQRLGIPFEAQMYWTFSNCLGIGVSWFANFNSQRSFGGIMFCLQIGYL